MKPLRLSVKVDWIEEIEADVAQLEAEVFGDFSDDVGLACSGRPPEKCGALALDEVREGRRYLRWAHEIHLLVKGKTKKKWTPRQDSNLHFTLRRCELYPLSYWEVCVTAVLERDCRSRR